MKHFNIDTNVNNNNNNTNVDNNNTNVDNNTNDANNNTNDDDDDTYDGKIRDKISDIRAILSRLGNIVTKNDRDKPRGDKDKNLSVEQLIKSYLSDLIYKNKAIETSSNELKIQINIHVNFVSSNDTGEIRTIFVWSNNEEIRLRNETDDIIKGLINSFLNKYQNEKIILRNGSNFVFESIGLLSYHIHKTILRRENSYIKSPEWIANKKTTINPKNEENRCFEYSIVVALHHKEIKNHPERISRIHHYFS